MTTLIRYIVINDLNKAFQDAISDEERQSIDEQIQKSNFLKAAHEKQANKMVFNWWCRCFSKAWYLYEFDLYLGKDEKRELHIGGTVVLDLSKKLENTHFMLFFNNFGREAFR